MATADRVAAKPRALTEAATTILDRRPPTAATPIQDHQNWPLLPLPGLRVQADAAPRSQYGCGADRPHGCRPGSGGEDHPLETLSGPEAVVADLAGCAGSGHETGQYCRKDEQHDGTSRGNLPPDQRHLELLPDRGVGQARAGRRGRPERLAPAR